MRGNAYSNFNQFINPVRSPNTSVFVPRRVNRRPQPRTVATRVNLPQSRGHNMAGLQARNPMLTVNKRIEQIKMEKDQLLDQLRENDTLEKRLLEESDIARKKREEEGLARIHQEVRLLQERLREKELQEKWILDKTRQDKESQDKLQLETVTKNREELLLKINTYENRITEIQDQTTLEQLKQEKDAMTRKWKQIEMEEQAKHKREEMEKQAAILKQKEQQEIEKLELQRLQNETKHLRTVIESKSSEQKWLERRQPPVPKLPPSDTASNSEVPTTDIPQPKIRTITRRP